MNLNQVTIPSQDLAESVAFYRQLGLELIVDSIPRYARLTCPVGDATFSIHHTEALPIGEGITIYFECSELDQRVSELSALGVAFESPPIDQPWLWREASLRDPDGHKIILYFAGNNRKHPPWRVADS